MRRIIYQSIAAPELDRAALIHLLYHARLANERRGISGMLLRSGQRFLQVLEGPTWKLCATFGRWRMRYFDDANIAKALGTITAEANGAVPRVVDEAILDFFGCDHPKANQRLLHPV